MTEAQHLTAANLADELTGYVRRGGQRRLFHCRPEVLTALRDEMGIDPKPMYQTAQWIPTASDIVAYLTGIDIITDVSLSPGEWKLTRCRDNTIVIWGYLEPEPQ